MSRAIDKLMEEHALILDVLDAFSAALRGGRAAPPSRETIADFVRFCREYVDGLHHHKEEDLLFPAMVEQGFSPEQGPVGVMLHEHVQGRQHVAALAAIAQSSEALDDSEFAALEAHGRAFAALLASHIAKENNVLYPMALRMLPASSVGHLDAQAAAADEDARDRTRELEILATSFTEGAGGRARREPIVLTAGPRGCTPPIGRTHA